MWVKQYKTAENTSKIQHRFNGITQKKGIILYYPSFVKFKPSQTRENWKGDTILRNVNNILRNVMFQIQEKCTFSD